MSHYLGNPTGTFGMQLLPDAAPGWSGAVGRNASVKQLISGGTAAARGLQPRRTYSLSWPVSSPDEANLILGFQTGAWGAGPYALLDSSWDNLLRLDTSLMGSRRGVQTGWAATVGTVAYDSTIAAFQAPSGVIRWTGAGSASQFGEGTVVSSQIEPDTKYACPYVATETYQVRVYAKTSTSTASVTARVSGRNAANSLHTNVTGTPVTLNTTTWQPVTATATPGSFAGAQFVIVTLTCNTASAPNILLSNPQLDLGTSLASYWVQGLGTPRCTVPADSSTQVPTSGWRDVSLTLAEI